MSTIVSAFTRDQASRLTQVSKRQLGLWDRSGFYSPSLAVEHGADDPGRYYTFRDLVNLKVLHRLRNECKVSMPHLREVKARLGEGGEPTWASRTLFVLARRVVLQDSETGDLTDAESGQHVMAIPLVQVVGDLRDAINRDRQRGREVIGKIDVRTAGKRRPLILGTRIPVQTIKDMLADGYTEAEIVAAYPSLVTEDVQAALAFRMAA